MLPGDRPVEENPARQYKLGLIPDAHLLAYTQIARKCRHPLMATIEVVSECAFAVRQMLAVFANFPAMATNDSTQSRYSGNPVLSAN